MIFAANRCSTFAVISAFACRTKSASLASTTTIYSANPPLSSVIPNPRQAGYQAATLLDKMMDGEHVEATTYPIAPIGTATRHSTDLVAIEDPAISAAIRFIQSNALDGIHVGDVLHAVPMSRTLLERKFQQHLNRSPYEMIQQIRFQHAQELLLRTEFSVSEISQRSGFLTPEYFSATFKKRFGVGPRAYRQQSRFQPGRAS